jgi:hypothetical protein
MLFSNKVNSLTEQVSRLDIDDNDMGLGGSETMECKCGMPLCICVAPPKSTDKPNPPATIAPVVLPQLKSEASAKSKGSTSSSNARYVII